MNWVPVLEENNQIVFGKNAVTELLKSKAKMDTVFVTDSEDRSLSHLVMMAKEAGIVVKTIHPIKLNKLCESERHQGIAALCSLCDYVTVDEMIRNAKTAGQAPFLVVCDGIEDPHNLGAIIRSAVCAGVTGVVIPERHGCGITTAVVRASAGAVSHIPIARVGNLATAIREIKEQGVFCYCADMSGTICYNVDLTGAVALVIGSEGKGVSRLVRDLCDGIVALPMVSEMNSLNASVAAGVLVYEVVRQNQLKAGLIR